MSYDSGRGKVERLGTAEKPKVLADVIECEENGPHEVHPPHWPPRANGINQAEPDMGLKCVKCGCWCVVYAWHATEENSRIKVVLPKHKVTA